MKLKIIEPGWINFTGDFGGVQFVDNVSTEDVSPRQAAALANAIQCVTLDGRNPSSSQLAIDSLAMPMGVVADLEPSTQEEGKVNVGTMYTRDQLRAIADAGGIEGLRKVAPAGVTGRSINGLIDSIISNQGGEPSGEAVIPVELAGSKLLPDAIEIQGKKLKAESVVRLAFEEFERGGKSIAEWNGLPDTVRENLIAAQVAVLKA